MLQLYHPMWESFRLFSLLSHSEEIPSDITRMIGRLWLLHYSHETIEYALKSERWLLSGNELILNPRYTPPEIYRYLTKLTSIEWYSVPHIPTEISISNLFYGKSRHIINGVSGITNGVDVEHRPFLSRFVYVLVMILFEFFVCFMNLALFLFDMLFIPSYILFEVTLDMIMDGREILHYAKKRILDGKIR